MKRITVAVGLLVLLAGMAALNLWYLRQLTDQVSGQLEQAQTLVAQQGDWESAQAVTEDAYRRFSDATVLLHITLRHADIDSIRSSFREVLAFLDGAEHQPAEYAAANARLLTQLELLAEGERPSLQNFL
jgi:hypothetical protein